MKNVTIYSSPTCHFCHMAKEFFKTHSISFTDKDVMSDQNNRSEMISRSGQMGVPVIFVDNEMVVGFNETKLKQLLELS